MAGWEPGGGAAGDDVSGLLSSGFLTTFRGDRAQPERVTHRTSSSRKITLLQQPANTRPTAKAGRMAGAGQGERARRGSARLYGYPRKPGSHMATAEPPSSAVATDTARRGVVVRSQPRPCSSEGASRSQEDYKSQHAARPYVSWDEARLSLAVRLQGWESVSQVSCDQRL